MKTKKIIALVLAVALMVAVFAGCGKKNSKISDGLELTIFMHFNNRFVFKDDYPLFVEAAKRTGVTLHATASEAISESATAWQTMVVSDTLPDIIHYSYSDMNQFGLDGGLIPLEDLIKKYAPNIQKYLDTYPIYKARATASDGHIYCIPGSLSGLDEGSLPSQGWVVRQDWLDKLGLEAPTTVDELHDVLTAFKTKDPNGNGQADEIPFFSRLCDYDCIINLAGGTKDWYTEDGQNLVYGPMQEDYKAGVKLLAQWYKEGLVDREIFTRGSTARDSLYVQNNGGLTHDWFSSTTKYADKFANDVPGINLVGILPPKNEKGRVEEWTGRTPLHDFGWGISVDNKHVEETMKYFDFWMSEEGSRLLAYGIEGVHYTMVDGEPIFTDEVLSSGDVPGYMRGIGQQEISAINSIAAEYQGMNEAGKAAFDLYKDVVRPVPFISNWTAEESDVYDKYFNDCKSFVNEKTSKWVIGSSDIDADWDSYIEELKKRHIEDCIKARNSAFKRSNGIN